MPELLWTRPSTDAAEVSDAVFVFAHGAGVAMDAPFMRSMAEGIAAAGVAVVRFEFDYMAQRRTSGKKRPPPAATKLIGAYQEVIATVSDQHTGPIVIGGKSMGGRIAAMVAGEDNGLSIIGVVCLGYPLHAIGKPDQVRIEPLQQSKAPILICQGDRDPFGTRAEFDALSLPDKVTMHWLEDGDHDFGPRGRASVNRADNLRSAAQATALFVKQQDRFALKAGSSD